MLYFIVGYQEGHKFHVLVIWKRNTKSRDWTIMFKCDLWTQSCTAKFYTTYATYSILILTTY